MSQKGFLEALGANFLQAIPHARECGIVVEALDDTGARARMPWRPEWLGDTGRGVYHTGVVTTLVDTVSGLAALAGAGRFEIIATLDLRMDFLRPAAQGKDLRVHASCYRVTRSITFVRASAWQDDEQAPVAVSQSTFMRGAPGPR
ncbi:MAG: PaaI family thioesterase [Gammaproteobacteria bacterium]